VVRRSPDEPPAGWFLKAPIVATPGILWWQTPEDEHPPTIKRSPDEPPVGWFLLGPAPVTTPTIIFRSTPEDGRLPPFRPDPYDSEQRPLFIPPPLLPFYAQTNSDEFYPQPPLPRFDYSQSFPIFVPPTTVGIAGIAWMRQPEVLARSLPPQADFGTSYAPSPPPTVGISGIAWLRTPDVQVAPLPTAMGAESKTTYLTFLPPPPAGIAGIAWMRTTDDGRMLPPLPPQLDYSQAWNPQFILPPPVVLVISPNPTHFGAMHSFGRMGSSN
jgi:hypothetical protein